MKFGQCLPIEIFFFKNHAEAGRLVLDLFSVFGKSLYEVKANGLEVSLSIFRQLFNLAYDKKLYNTLGYRSRGLLNFSF